ncbi:MAG: PaaI family thioesterase [Burkholderiaceae bacterium]|nr:PaaI family thioesterase [Burkholderiaceae bacterium]
MNDTNDAALAALARTWLDTLFAPWVKALDLQVESVRAGRAVLRLPFAPELCREGGTICGQALMAAADTAMVLAVSAQLGEFRPTTTVSLNTAFMRPVAEGDVRIVAQLLKPGRTLMFGEIEMYGADGKLAAHATTTYAMV